MAASGFFNKVVLVTGSSSGIGQATATYFAKLGANVVISGRNELKIKTALANVQASSIDGSSVISVAADITSEDSCKSLIDQVINKFGQLDVLVNNAGISRICHIDQPNILAEFDAVYATNVRPIVALCHLAVPHLIKTKGNIVNVSSCTGLRPFVLLFKKCPGHDRSSDGLRTGAERSSSEQRKSRNYANSNLFGARPFRARS